MAIWHQVRRTKQALATHAKTSIVYTNSHGIPGIPCQIACHLAKRIIHSLVAVSSGQYAIVPLHTAIYSDLLVGRCQSSHRVAVHPISEYFGRRLSAIDLDFAEGLMNNVVRDLGGNQLVEPSAVLVPKL